MARCMPTIQGKKGRVRAKDRPSKQKKDRQGWTKVQMRKEHARTCVNCRKIRPQTEMVRVVRVVCADEDTDQDDERTHVEVVVDWNHPARKKDETNQSGEQEEEVEPRTYKRWTGRSAYLCPKRTCCEKATTLKKGNPVARALKVKKMDPNAAEDIRNMIQSLQEKGWLEDEEEEAAGEAEGADEHHSARSSIAPGPSESLFSRV